MATLIRSQKNSSPDNVSVQNDTSVAYLHENETASSNGNVLNTVGHDQGYFLVEGIFSGVVSFEGAMEVRAINDPADVSATWSTALIEVRDSGNNIVTSTSAPGLFRIYYRGSSAVRAPVTLVSGSVTVKVSSACGSGRSPIDIALSVGGVTTSSDLDNVAGNAVQVGNGPAGLGVQRIAIASDNLPIATTVASLPLPAGAATAALQTSGNVSLSSIDSKSPALVSGRVPTDGSGVTQPISAVALPLPAGASTSANQATANASLASIDGKITAVNTGNVTISSSALPAGASTAANQSTTNTSLSTLNTNVGAQADAAATTDSGSFSIIAFIKRVLSKLPVLGRAPSTAATPVVLANELMDKFGNIKVCFSYTVFEAKRIASSRPLVFDDQQTSGSGTSSTFVANKACTRLSVGNLTAGTRVSQTFRWIQYQAGHAQRIKITFLFGAAATGITRRAGYFNANNGLFLEQTSSAVSVVVRSFTSGAAVDTAVAQASWNIDRLDGTGASGKTLDLSKTQLFVCEFGWLGTDGVLFSFFIDGLFIPVHLHRSANIDTAVYMSTPSLPIRYEISNNGAGPAASMDCICCAVESSGGQSSVGQTYPVSRGVTAMSANNDALLYPLIAIRLRAGYEFATVRILRANVVCTSTAAYRWVLLLNPTVLGTALSFSSPAGRAIDVDVSRTATTTVTGGTELDGGESSSTNESPSAIITPTSFVLGSSIAGVSDIVVLAVQRLTGTSETYYGSITVQEEI